MTRRFSPWHLSIPLFVLLATSYALAESTDETTTFDRAYFHGKAEVGLGLLGLPTAEVCTNRTLAWLPCKHGDSSPMLEVWQLFRPNPLFATGAGITIGLFPITDAPKQEQPGVNRDHRRGYFTAEAIARFYLLHGPVWEAWLGGTGGLVVVSDTYSTSNATTDRAYIGPRGITIRSEGYTVGFAAGFARYLTDTWTVGASVRYALWSLPTTAARDSLQDEASLVGRVGALIVGINVGYRLSL
jgi:hypothetical protein